MPKDSDLSAVLVSDLTDLKGKVQVLGDVLNVMDWALDATFERLEASGALPPEEGMLNEYRRAIKILRQRGFTRPRSGQSSVKCPGCQAVLKGVEGKAGDRCSWCGYEFK